MADRSIPDFTPEQIDALPRGPVVETFRLWTAEELEARKMGRGKIERESRPIRFIGFRPDDRVYYLDSHGVRWRVGQWCDGGWYKELSNWR